MPHPKFIRLHFLLLVIVCICGCQTSRNQQFVPPPTKKENRAWMSQNKFVKATKQEIEAAKSSEVPFTKEGAVSPDGNLKITFHRGRDTRSKNGNYMNTSYFKVVDTLTGKQVARFDSWDSEDRRLRPETGFDTPRIWFTEGQTKFLVYQRMCVNSGPDEITTLITKEGDRWRVSYLNIPLQSGYAVNEGAEPVGLLHDAIICDPLYFGEPLKINISDIPPTRSPFHHEK